MIKHVCKQMGNQWKSNLGLMGGLFLIAVALWYAVDFIYATALNHRRNLGFEWENVYYLQLGCLPAESPLFLSDTRYTQEGAADFEIILERLRAHPEVEHVSASRLHVPYGGATQGGDLRYDSLSVSCQVRYVTPDHFSVFGVKGVSGETSAELGERLHWGKIIVTRNVADQLFAGEPAVGRVVENQQLPPCNEIVAVCEDQKWGEYSGYGKYIYVPLRYQWFHTQGITEFAVFIRTGSHGNATEFIRNFRKEMSEQLKVGNLYLEDMRPVAELRRNGLSEYRNSLYTQLGILIFVLLNIFLALLGTFWLRVQQRRAEIGLRITFGSTQCALRRMLITEGLVLVTLACLPALIVGLNLGVSGVVSDYPVPFGHKRFICVSLITYTIMVLVAIAAIVVPARRAMRLHPAEALRDE